MKEHAFAYMLREIILYGKTVQLLCEEEARVEVGIQKRDRKVRSLCEF